MLGCNLNQAYCTKPNECICFNGWKGENCNECRVQPSCPGTCSVPHGCVCSDTVSNGLCKIGDNPPDFKKDILNPNVMPSHCINHDWNLGPTSRKISQEVTSQTDTSEVPVLRMLMAIDKDGDVNRIGKVDCNEVIKTTFVGNSS